MHHTMRFSRSVLLLAGMLTLGVGTLQAQDIFTNANGNWNVANNWNLGALPGTNSAGIGTNKVIAIVAVTDGETCSNLYVGGTATLPGNGTLNISGGSLVVTGLLYVGNNAASTGTITQTSGSMTNLGVVYLAYTGTGVWTVAGGTVVNMGIFYMGHFSGGNATLIISGGVMSNASSTVFGNGAYIIQSSLIVTNTGVLYLSGGLTTYSGSATTTVSQSGGVIICTNATGLVTGGSGYDNWTMTGGALTNMGAFAMAQASATDIWTMTSGVWSNQGAISVSYAGNGTLNMNGGTLLAFGGFLVPTTSTAGTMPTVTQTGGLIVSGTNGSYAVPNGIGIGSGGSAISTELWTMAGGVMTNNGPLFVGKGLRGSLVITNTGTWYQNASTYVGGYYNYNGTVAEPGTGTMTVAAGGLFLSASNVLVASYGGGSNAIGSLTVSNATFISTNSNTALKIGTNGVVTVCGTQRVFQVAALTNFAGIFSNNIAQVAGGLDITTTNAGALTLTNNGLATLVFSQNPVAPGNFWGLRWLGTNHVAALTAMHAASQLTWNDSQLSANYRGLSGIYTDAVYTYVGFKLNALPVNGTSMFFW